ncbi:hypothetical protein PROVRETT_07646 [Providencia rettgeri DSM 1131]|nr:hypothetical protein PROVRETT_07646 [Providencia rettgeri DSM 1131]
MKISLITKIALTAFINMIHQLIALGFLVINYGYRFLSHYLGLL